MKHQGIFGHSMGGHGALTIALAQPKDFQERIRFRTDRVTGDRSVGAKGAGPLSWHQ